jgi:N-acetylglucosamine-6-phosphate deacetylase
MKQKTNTMRTAIYNGTIYTGGEILRSKAILVDDGVIVELVDASAIPGEYEKKDLHNLNIAPSFIDLQIYGGNGKMFSHELSAASLRATFEYCKSGGAAHFMITMATNSIEKFLKGIQVVKEYWDKGGEGLLGLHMEGPYLNPVKKGAHIEKYIKKPTFEEVQMLLDKGRGIIKMMTIAPEMCDDGVIRLLIDNNLVSAGHSNATYREAVKAFSQGIPAATHLFNAMSAFQSREPGMVGAIYDHPFISSSVVCDGVHVDFAAIRISKRIMLDRLFFITDAVAETTSGDYQHVFKKDRYTLPDGTLSGSALTMMECVKNGVNHVGIVLEEALRMASLYPAKLLKDDLRIGSIKKGYKASFVLFDDTLNIKQVLTGKEIFPGQGS